MKILAQRKKQVYSKILEYTNAKQVSTKEGVTQRKLEQKWSRYNIVADSEFLENTDET